ncbi:hypothetical protein L226DRAFT_574568 [Lentinus tigrinus ALCF2SS1-7]|uniref:Mid2 domain-containing protein n=1 Tax=Lentinus tigrinus ALCF2SS1-6 TaxID=1328759 RepID=A0A5C2RX27_9APHY|nr:hypothetical protein L227DRAFT_615321 [Lentinus tigrinus ALCF2SS1-6]RPD70683.1 hypothetical protein L226DRAFT_574568 [Lentinus tigrinus ALCF2SS1-7]
MPVPRIVDDSSLDLIRYIDPAPNLDDGYTYNWTHITSEDGSLSPFENRTISYCLQSGAMALFTFQGTRVSVYGSESDQVADVHIWSSYSINGQSNTTHKSGARGGDHLLFFDSGYMPYDEYTLQIYVGYAEDDAGYSLDYIRYETTSTAATSASLASSSLVTPTYSPILTLTSVTTLSSSSVASLSSQKPTASSTKSIAPAATTATVKPETSLESQKTGIIVLSTLGGVAFLLALAYTVYNFWRKRGPYRRIDLNDEIPGEHEDLVPSSSNKTRDPRVLFSSSPPPTPEPDAGPRPQPVGDGRISPYGPHAVISTDEKKTYLSVAGTIAASASAHDEEDA